MVLAHGNFNFHTAVGIVAQDFDDFACRGQIFFRIARQFHIDDLAIFCRTNAFGIQDDALGNALVLRNGHGDVAFFGQTCHHRGIGTLNDVQHLSLSATASVHAYRPHGDHITVHQAAHLAFIQNQVGIAFFFFYRYCKTKAIAVGFNAAFDQGQFLCDTHQAAAVDVNLTISDHRTQATAKKFHLIFTN